MFNQEAATPKGLSAACKGETIGLALSGGTAVERLGLLAIEPAEALARLEAPGYPTMDPEELEDKPNDAPNCTTATVELLEPEGLLTLRKVRVPGPARVQHPRGQRYAFE